MVGVPTRGPVSSEDRLTDEVTPERRSRSADERRALWLLASGAALGLIFAAAGLLRDAESAALPGTAIARVGSSLIQREDYLRLLAGYEADTRGPSDAEVRLHILNRMIEEELLIQRALDLGLAHLDRRVRSNLTASLIASIVAEAEESEPSERELSAFYAENASYFTAPGRLRVRQIFFRVPSPLAGKAESESTTAAGSSPGVDTRGKPGEGQSRARAEEARRRLMAGEDWAQVKKELGDDEISPVPSALLPALKLREYVGPTVVGSVRGLEVGEISAPIRSGTGLHLIQLLEREPARTPPLAEMRPQAEREWRRREGDRALRSYLDELRDESDVVIAPDVVID